jgi:hypothetical protein
LLDGWLGVHGAFVDVRGWGVPSLRRLSSSRRRVPRGPRSQERGELDLAMAKLVDLLHDLIDRSLAATEYRAFWDRGGSDDLHRRPLY